MLYAFIILRHVMNGALFRNDILRQYWFKSDDMCFWSQVRPFEDLAPVYGVVAFMDRHLKIPNRQQLFRYSKALEVETINLHF